MRDIYSFLSEGIEGTKRSALFMGNVVMMLRRDVKNLREDYADMRQTFCGTMDRTKLAMSDISRRINVKLD